MYLDPSPVRNRRHALPSSKRFEEHFGFVSQGMDMGSDIDYPNTHKADKSYSSQRRQKKQAGNGAPAPHQRTVSTL